MSVRDKWPFSRYKGRVRVELTPYSPDEQQKVRKFATVFLVGVTVLALSQNYLITFMGMATAGVFVRLYYA